MLSLLGVLLTMACSTMPRPAETGRVAGLPERPTTGTITAVGYNEGLVYVARANEAGCSIEEHQPGEAVKLAAVLDLCPTRITVLGDRSLRLVTPQGEMIVGEDGTSPEAFTSQISPGEYISRSARRLTWHHGEEAASAEGSWTGRVAILEKEDAVVAVRREAEGERLIRLDWPDSGESMKETVLTDPVERILTIEPDEDQKELALSVLRNGSYDIAITNAEEKITNWVPADPADELTPRWSPVGYKLSYVVDNPGGDILRTVHVPTAAMVLLDFPDAAITDYVWLPDGEHVIVAASSLLESDYVVEADYTGAARKVLVAPEQRFERRVERLPGTPAGSALIMPESIRYGAIHPLVIWATGGAVGGTSFNPVLVPLLERDDVGLLVINGSVSDLDGAFEDSLSEMDWTDPSQTWLAGPGTAGGSSARFRRIDEPGELEAVRIIVEELEQK